jgi:hypothetical protein
MFCSFLALVLLKELENRPTQKGLSFSWEDIKRDLLAFQEIELEVENKPWLLRTELRGCCGDVLNAVGVAIPPRVRC